MQPVVTTWSQPGCQGPQMDQREIELTKLRDHLKGVALVRARWVERGTVWIVLYIDAFHGQWSSRGH